MRNGLSKEQVGASLTGFIRERFLDGDAAFDESASLYEWGVLTSLNSAVLLNHIQEEFGPDVPLERLDEGAFKDVRTLAATLCGPAGTAHPPASSSSSV